MGEEVSWFNGVMTSLFLCFLTLVSTLLRGWGLKNRRSSMTEFVNVFDCMRWSVMNFQIHWDG